MSTGLTAEQQKRMEENRKRALAKRAGKTRDPLLYPQTNARTKSEVKQTKSVPSQFVTPASTQASKTQDIGNHDRIEQNRSNVQTHSMLPMTTKNVRNKDRIEQNSSSVQTTSMLAIKTQNVKNQDKMEQSRTSLHSASTLPITTQSVGNQHQIEQKSSSVNQASILANATQTISYQDRIEQNRLKALAKRAEKLTKSPIKNKTTGYINPSNQVYSVHNSGKALIENLNKESISVLNKQSATSNSSNLSKGSESTSSFNTKDSSKFSANSGLQSNYSNSFTNLSSNTKQQTSLSRDSSNLGSNSSKLPDTEKPQGEWNAFDSMGKGAVKGKCVLVTRDRFSVEIGYSAPLIQCFKTMETKLYDIMTKKWSFRLVEYDKFMNSVRCLKPAVDIEPLPKALLQSFDSQIKGADPVRTIPIADLSKVEPTLVNSLMSFQREGVNFGVYKNGRVLIADDMGLGKTIQAICLACYYRLEWPLLVVVPSSVRFDWAQQIQRWVPSLDPQTINVAVTGKDSLISGLVNIISYDLMARKADVLKAKKFRIIIMDECHLLKNFKTARCKAATPLLQIAKRVILLSGTPALSRPSELYTIISAVCPFQFKYHDFGVRYCDGKQLQWGWDFSGSSNMAELQLLLEEKIMIRRLKKEVLSELPDKVRQMVQLDPSFIKVDKVLEKASKVIGKIKKTEERGALLDFFHKSGHAKIKAIKNYVLDLLEGEKKFIIFAHHGDVLDEIEVIVKSKIDNNYIRIDGKTSSEQRNIVCKKFQHNQSVRAAILSITAANAGLNMSAANLVVFAELFWNPGILVQAEDRAHRIGQQDSVSVHYLVATGTSDDLIWPMIQKKLDVLGKAGLTKDNFSAAETTRFVDQEQEQITKFLEESFSADFECMNQSDEVDEKLPSKPCVSKQTSILEFTSPLKDIPQSSSLQSVSSKSPSKRPKQQSLFQYLSPVKKTSDDTKRGQGQSDKTKGQGCVTEDFLDDDFDELLADEWDIGLPPNKKIKT